MEVPKPQPPITEPSTPGPAGSPVYSSAAPQGTVRTVSPLAAIRRPSSRTSVFIIIGLVLSVFVLGVGYLVFTRPNTGPATTLFAKLFPSRSGLIQLQTIELNFDAVLNSSVFQKLHHQGAPIEIPPLGKPNPFL